MTPDEIKNENINVSDKDAESGVDFASAFSEELAKDTARLTSEPSETSAARAIRDILSDNGDFVTRLEPFNARPLLGRRCFTFAGIWFALCDIIYYVSFLADRTAGILVTLLALVMFVVGMSILILMFLGNHRFDVLLPKKACYNVTTEFTTEKRGVILDKEQKPAPDKTIVLCANHDSLPGTYFDNKGAFRKVAMVVIPLSIFIFVLFCFIKIGVGNDTAAKICGLIIPPAITTILGIIVFCTHFCLNSKRVRENNNVATAVSLSSFAYFYSHRDKLPQNVRFVFASFGGENSGHAGSKAFVEKHTALDRNFAQAQVICLSDILSGSFRVAQGDDLRRVKYSDEMVRAVATAAGKLDIVAPVEDNKFASLHGYAATAFAKEGIRAVNISGKDYDSVAPDTANKDVVRALFLLVVGTVDNLLQEE